MRWWLLRNIVLLERRRVRKRIGGIAGIGLWILGLMEVLLEGEVKGGGSRNCLLEYGYVGGNIEYGSLV